MQPVRHALGGLLLKQGHVGKAKRVFREDLGLALGFLRRKAKLNNVWGLYSLHKALLKGGKSEEACMLKTQLNVAAACANIELSVSCYCRLSTAAKKRCY